MPTLVTSGEYYSLQLSPNFNSIPFMNQIPDDPANSKPAPRKHRRFWKRLLIIAAIHVVVLILIPAANSFYCSKLLPDEFKDAPQGKFSSDVTCFVAGRIFINDDFSDMACGETREVDVAIYYNLWSFVSS